LPGACSACSHRRASVLACGSSKVLAGDACDAHAIRACSAYRTFRAKPECSIASVEFRAGRARVALVTISSTRAVARPVLVCTAFHVGASVALVVVFGARALPRPEFPNRALDVAAGVALQAVADPGARPRLVLVGATLQVVAGGAGVTVAGPGAAAFPVRAGSAFDVGASVAFKVVLGARALPGAVFVGAALDVLARVALVVVCCACARPRTVLVGWAIDVVAGGAGVTVERPGTAAFPERAGSAFDVGASVALEAAVGRVGAAAAATRPVLVAAARCAWAAVASVAVGDATARAFPELVGWACDSTAGIALVGVPALRDAASASPKLIAAALFVRAYVALVGCASSDPRNATFA